MRGRPASAATASTRVVRYRQIGQRTSDWRRVPSGPVAVVAIYLSLSARLGARAMPHREPDPHVRRGRDDRDWGGNG